LWITQYNDSDFSVFQILLIDEIVVVRQKHVKSSLFGNGNKSPFLKVSQPSCFASLTLWPLRKDRNGRGVP
jgi:hypothetical protein